VGSEKNPVEAYLTEKTAGFMSGLKSGITPASGMQGLGEMAGSGIAGGAMRAGGAALVGAGVVGAQKLYDAVTKAHDFRTMLEYDGELAQMHQENPRLFNQMYSTLRTFNPAFSKDPVVSSTYMRQLMADPATAGGKVVDALNFRDKMKSPIGDTITRAALKQSKK
jgi:hypothetical protein